jgi:hypothetical protein
MLVKCSYEYHAAMDVCIAVYFTSLALFLSCFFGRGEIHKGLSHHVMS